MEIIVSSVLAVSCAVLVVIYVWKFLNWVWFIPKKMEKSLRQQGFNGNPYRLLFGDFKDFVKMMREAKSKPMNLSNDIVQRVIPFIHKTVNNYGQDCFLWLGPKPSAIIFNPDHIREIFSKSYVFQKPHNPMSKYLVRGLVTYETDKWAKHRRLINPAFHLDKLMHMVPSFELSCSEMLKKWENMVGNEGWCELDVWPYLQGLTSDAISRTAFGSSFEEGRTIFELQKKQAELLMTSLWSVYIPLWRFLPTNSNRMLKRNLKEVESLVLQLINKRMKAMETGETSDDLLGLLLESNLKEIQQEGNKFGMSLQEVIEECKLFYIAGQETTSALLVWTMILLGKHEDWQTRAREEVLQVCSKPKPDFQELNQLKIVTMIIYEILRLYPPAIMFSRVIRKETKLGKDLILPAGLQLFLPTILLHHDPKIWGNDAKEFNPERFSGGISKTTQGQSSYYPFGWGPRICIGQNFAMLEAKMALAMILQTYSFKLSSSYSHAPHLGLTLQPQHGAHLILHKLFGGG